MEMKIKSQVQFNDDLSQRSNIVSGDSLSNSFAKIHHDLNDYEIAANIAANDRPKNLLYIHDILSDSVSTATEEILGYPLDAGTYVYSAEIYTVQNPSVANVTKIEFLGSDGNTVVGTCNIACDTKKEEHINVTLSDEAYYIKYYRDTYSSETVGYLKTSEQMICLPNVYAAFPEYTMYAPSLGETFLEVEDSVKTYDVQDTYDSSSYKAISGKGVAAAIETLDVSSVGGSGKYISEISETGGKIAATAETMDTTPTANSTVPVTSGGVAASQAVQDAEIAWNVNQGVKNLIKLNPNTYTSGNVVVKLNDDGTISVSLSSGSTANATFSRAIKTITNLRDMDLILNGCPSGGNYSSGYALYISDDGTTKEKDEGNGVLVPKNTTVTTSYLALIVRSGTAISGTLTFKPMIRPAAITDSTFQPYALPNPTLTPAVIKAVDEGAKNLLKFDAIGSTTYGTIYESNGVKFTLNADNTVTFERISASSSAANCILILNGARLDVSSYCDGNHILSGCPSGGGSSSYEMMATVSGGAYTKRDYGAGVTLDSVSGISPYIQLTVRSGFTGTATYKPMICTVADWNVSQKYVSYCPSLPDLYSSYINDIILALLGRGTEIPNNSDLDNYTTPGNYYVLNNTNAGTISNKPIGGSGFKLIVRTLNAANRPRQEFYKPNTPETFYVRSITTDNTWSAWYQFTGTAVT